MAGAGPIIAIAVASFALAFGALNRWLVNGAGIGSFGQVWSYFASYTDFGFARRELVGTLLTVTGVNSLFANAYACAYALYESATLLLIALIAFYCVRYRPFGSRLGYFLVFFSPAFILQNSYLTGSQDLEILILTALGALYVTRLSTLSVVCVIGVLTHELMVYVLPFLFLLYSARRDNGGIFQPRHWPKYGLAMAPVVVVIGAIAVGGTVNASEPAYKSLMAARIPAAVTAYGDWSGWFELSSSLAQNAHNGRLAIARLAPYRWYYALPLLYALSLAAVVSIYTKGLAPRLRLALGVSLLLPLTVIVIGSDIYRWLGLSADLSLLALLVFGRYRALAVPRPLLWFFAVCAVFAPLGYGEITQPFPALQYVLGVLG